ncbi:MAG: type II toxin-antitoxin system RelE/ParE family toxin [Kingella sp. (in: b-proteobacteria)]
MRIFKYKQFCKFAAKQSISDTDLYEAIKRAENGLIDADLGGGVIKQRIARKGQGKSSGYRSIILFRRGDKAFFVHGFAKNDRDNISTQELHLFKSLALDTFMLNEAQLTSLLLANELTEIHYE